MSAQCIPLVCAHCLVCLCQCNFELFLLSPPPPPILLYTHVSVQVWSSTTGAPLKTLGGHTGRVMGVDVAPGMVNLALSIVVHVNV